MGTAQVIEIREVEIDSPLDSLNIGDKCRYKGQYVRGYEEGSSNIKRFYKDVIFIDGIPEESEDITPVWVELDDGKLILLGVFDNKQNFKTSERFNNNNLDN